MVSRGAIGFRWKGRDYLTNNLDHSYPSVLGRKVANYIRKTRNWKRVIQKVEALQLVRRTISSMETKTPELSEILKSGKMIDDSQFVTDSLFCEYAYIINLDTMRLEFYRGGQTSPHKKGRYAKRTPAQQMSGTKYYPVALLAEFPLNKLPATVVSRMTAAADADKQPLKLKAV